MKRPLTVGELFAIMAVLFLPALGWGFAFTMKVQANETNIANMQQINVELLKEIKGQSVILTDIRIELADKDK